MLFLHLADVSTPCKPFKMCHDWTTRVLVELFAQVLGCFLKCGCLWICGLTFIGHPLFSLATLTTIFCCMRVAPVTRFAHPSSSRLCKVLGIPLTIPFTKIATTTPHCGTVMPTQPSVSSNVSIEKAIPPPLYSKMFRCASYGYTPKRKTLCAVITK